VNEAEVTSDAYLIGAIVNGDPDAVRPLIERYQRPLAGMLHRALGSADVDDVCQETWIRVVRSAHRYDPSYPFTSWLFGIAWNLVRVAWRRRRVVVEAPESVSSVSAEDRIIANDEARRVRDLVAQLPEHLSQAILLRYFEELSEREMAERLGVPIGTVKSRIHYGLKKLALALAEETT
jgi:RNA polymerase sigma-70 factor (ECF subfamily)